MQLWLELGALGAALTRFCSGPGYSTRIGLQASAASGPHGGRGVSAAVATAYLVIGALSFGVWQEWWLGLGALAPLFAW